MSFYFVLCSFICIFAIYSKIIVVTQAKTTSV